LSVADKNTKLIGFNAGIVPIFASLYVIGLGGTAVFKFMAVGAYLTFLTAIAMILSVFEVIRLPIQVEPIQTLNRTAHSSINAPTENVSSSVHHSFFIVFSVLVSLVISHFSLNIRSVMAELDISDILLVWSQIIVLLIGFSGLVGYFIQLDQYARPLLFFGGTLVTIGFFIMSIASLLAHIILGGILISIGLALKSTYANFKVYRQIEMLIGIVIGMLSSFLLYIVFTGNFGWRLSMMAVTILVIILTEVEVFLHGKSSDTTTIKKTNVFLNTLLIPAMLYCAWWSSTIFPRILR